MSHSAPTDSTFALHHGIIAASDVRVGGDDTRALRRDAERGLLVRLRRGVYLAAPVWRQLTGAEQYVMRLRAFALTARTPVTFSHQSAAVLHGLSLLGPVPAHIHIAARPSSGGRSDGDIRRHACTIDGLDTATVDGLAATSAIRTALDLSSFLPFADAVVALDALLHSGACTPCQLSLASSGSDFFRTRRKVERAIGFASEQADSPGESLSRAVIHQLGLPAPVLQQPFFDHLGFVGRADFWWPEHNLIGEFDGRSKYSRGRFGSDRPPEEHVWSEKLREDRLRAVGPRVTRWTWATLAVPSTLLAQLRAAGLAP